MKRTAQYLVTIDIPKGKNLNDLQAYISQAVKSWRHQPAVPQDAILDFVEADVRVKLHKVTTTY